MSAALPDGPLLDLPADYRTPDAFENGLFTATHRLAETGLFTEENVLRMLETHPRDLANVSRMGHDPTVLEWSEGLTEGLSPEDVLAALKKGRLWLNIRKVLDHQPEAAAAINRLYDDLEAACPGFTATRRSANVLVSSPGAMVYYHIDVPQNILWHVSGEKRVWAYPQRLADTPRDELEAIVAVKKAEDAGYHPEWDDAAFAVDLKPGEWITWPQHTPHRVQNTVGLNISVSTEHYSPRAFRYVRAHRANRMLRDRFGLSLSSTKTSGLGYQAKAAAYLAGRAVQEYVTKKRGLYHYPKTFRVDPKAPHATVELNGGPTPAAFLPRAAAEPKAESAAEPERAREPELALA
ncbi:cupin-like domain-containing protein [Alienimonas californiensis]|uniref:JmjC domain-containing protein n=1 Tax=Alienimonas californiensis TaxID=2527989 RepID=A0A517PEB2_9PLAN|nr:cupin-like domain-containing protein [Alienimonas californiensis]QDT17716.1 hypothetical protein CA12_38470 [Alienimonas californiensis]